MKLLALSFLLLAHFFAVHAAEEECNLNNVCFMLDESGSINSTEYAEMVTFINEVATQLDAVNVDLSYCATAFATTAETIVEFPSTLQEFTDVINGPRALPEGDTNMQLGMQLCIKELIMASSGRSSIIMITDGKENGGNVVPIANDAKALGIVISTVGIGNKVDNKFLRSLASDPSYYIKTDFDNFDEAVDLVVNSTCDHSPPSPSPSPIPCDIQNVCFSIDESGSINETEYFQEMLFVSGVASELHRVNNVVFFGAMAFATVGEKILEFPSDLPALKEVTTGPRAIEDGQTNMQEGVQGCVDMLSIPLKNRVIILLTDGRETEEISNVTPVADAAKADGIAIATVGLGNKVNSTFLKSLATDPSFYVKSSFDDLVEAIEEVTVNACSANERATGDQTEAKTEL